MEPWIYFYGGLQVASAVPIPEWEPFRHLERARIPDVRIRIDATPVQNASESHTLPVGTPGEFRFRVPGVADYRIHGGVEITIAPLPGVELNRIRPWLLGSAWGALCYQRGLFVVHASAVRVANGAVVFCAPAGMGKSTMAAILNARGYPLVSDDLCRFDFSANGSAIVYPSAPRLKLWTETLTALGWNTAQLEPDQIRTGKFCVWNEDNQTAPLPVRGIYLLAWGESRILGLSGLAALRHFMAAATYRPRLLESMGHLTGYSRHCVEFLRKVPLWQLKRPRDLSAVDRTIALLTEHWSRPDVS